MSERFYRTREGAEKVAAEREALRSVAHDSRALLRAIDDLIRHSEGVYGLHRNGDNAPWEELIEGGRYGDWLEDHEALRRSLAALDRLNP